MMETILITGDVGTEKYFLIKRQYQFEDKSTRQGSCDGCSEDTEYAYVTYYRILIGTESFYIPEGKIAIEGTIKPEWMQDKFKFHEFKSDQPKDYRQAVLDTIGVDLEKTTEESHDGYEYGEKMIEQAGKNNGKRYGQVETDEEEDPCESS